MATWASDFTVTPTNVREEISDLTAFFQSNEVDDQDALLQSKFIKTGKDAVARRIKTRVQPIFARSTSVLSFDEYLEQSGLSYSDLDTLLDKIKNYTDVKPTVIAATMVALIECAIVEMRGTYGTDIEAFGKHLERWNENFDKRFEEMIQLLQFDFNGDSIVSNYERVMPTSTHFDRV